MMPTSTIPLMSGAILSANQNAARSFVRAEGDNFAPAEPRWVEPDDGDNQIHSWTLNDLGNDNGGDHREDITSDIKGGNDMIYDIEDGEDEHGHSIAGSIWSSNRNFYPSSSIGGASSAAAHWDFLAVITAVCEAYQHGTYLKMMMLNARQWEPLGEGTTFRVSRSEMKLTAFSSRNHRRKQIVSNRLVIKRNDYCGEMTAAQARSFVKELRTLHHLDGHPYIVNLRGVGWFQAVEEANYDNVKPAIILEEAFNTLDYLVGRNASLSYDSMLQIFGQITSGLRSLHSCGIAHGDLKPGNILLFKRLVVRDGVQIESFVAKLSDFESVAYKAEGEALFFPPGTMGFRAPEVDEACRAGGGASVSFMDLMLADAWSLGTVFAVMLSGTQLLHNSNPAERVRRLVEDIKRKLESSSAESEHAKVVLDVLKHTIRIDPSRRRLSEVERLLAPFLEDIDRRQWTHPGSLLLTHESSLIISHESLKSLVGPVKDKIALELARISSIRNHPRRSKALWELGIMSLSRFADPDASIDQGLAYLQQSAQEGDIRAKTFCHRFYKAFGRPIPYSDEAILSFLKEAAGAGHQSALEDLWERDASAAMKAQAVVAEFFCRMKEGLDLGNSPLHKSAAMGNEDAVAALLAQPGCDINHRNDEDDTPLMLACRFGRFKIALMLLERGASAEAQNKFGENALHYAWCFGKQEGPIIIRKLAQHGAGLHDISRRKVPTSELDILPVLPGTPIERAAGRARHDLVLVFMELESLRGPSNGRLARRLLLWALRLHDTNLVDILLRSFIYDPSRFDSVLEPIINTKWLHQGEERSLIDAACGGWVTGAGVGCHYPLRIWLIMRHGHGWRQAIYNSISHLKSLIGYSETNIDQSIQWAFRESLYDALITLLRCKIEIAAIHDKISILCSKNNPLVWNMGTINACVIQPQEMYLIDRMYYDTSLGGTLAQQSFLSGDRYMFRLLTSKFRANAALPAPMPTTSKSSGSHAALHPFADQINLYSALPYTHHQDLWFAKELRRLNVPLFCPWDTSPFEQEGFGLYGFKDYIYPTPLVHAIAACCKPYICWLLRDGNASVQEKISAHHDLLHMIMSSRSLGLISFFFKGLQPQEIDAILLPPEYSTDNGSQVLRLFFEANLDGPAIIHHLFPRVIEMKQSEEHLSDPIEEVWDKKNITGGVKSEAAKILSCYWFLLSKYPHADIPLQPSFFKVLIKDVGLPRIVERDGGYLSRIKQEHFLRFTRRGSTYTRRRILGPTLLSSPVDSLVGERLANVMSIIPGMTLDYLSPSLFWAPFRRLWVAIAFGSLWTLALWLFGKLRSKLLHGAYNAFNVVFAPDTSSRICAFLFLLISALAVPFTMFFAVFLLLRDQRIIKEMVLLTKVARPLSCSYAVLASNLVLLYAVIIFNIVQQALHCYDLIVWIMTGEIILCCGDD